MIIEYNRKYQLRHKLCILSRPFYTIKFRWQMFIAHYIVEGEINIKYSIISNDLNDINTSNIHRKCVSTHNNKCTDFILKRKYKT